MSKDRYFSLLKSILLAGAIFMVGECLYHFSGIRMMGTATAWPAGAIVFGRFFMWLRASASLLVALILWYAAKQVRSADELLIFLGGFSLFHAVVLYRFSLLPLTEIWQSTPALFVWFSGYPWQLKVEAAILVAFGVFIGYGMLRKYITLPK